MSEDEKEFEDEEEFDPDHWDNSCQTLQNKFNTGWEWLEKNG